MATETAVACQNLGDTGVRQRRTLGWVAVAGAVALFVALVAVRAPAYAFVIVGLPAWGAALGLIQARRRTCVRLAGLGVKETDGGAVRVEGEELSEMRAEAGRISRRALRLAIIWAVIAVVLGWIARGITVVPSP